MPDRPDLVRVRLENGAHHTLTREQAEAAGLKPLKQPAVRRDGTPVPTKHRAPLGGAASAATTNPEATDASENKED